MQFIVKLIRVREKQENGSYAWVDKVVILKKEGALHDVSVLLKDGHWAMMREYQKYPDDALHNFHDERR